MAFSWFVNGGVTIYWLTGMILQVWSTVTSCKDVRTQDVDIALEIQSSSFRKKTCLLLKNRPEGSLIGKVWLQKWPKKRFGLMNYWMVFTHELSNYESTRWSLTIVTSRVITPINIVWQLGVITPLITGRGPPCMIQCNSNSVTQGPNGSQLVPISKIRLPNGEGDLGVLTFISSCRGQS